MSVLWISESSSHKDSHPTRRFNRLEGTFSNPNWFPWKSILCTSCSYNQCCVVSVMLHVLMYILVCLHCTLYSNSHLESFSTLLVLITRCLGLHSGLVSSITVAKFDKHRSIFMSFGHYRPRTEYDGKVMFWHVSVCLSTGGGQSADSAGGGVNSSRQGGGSGPAGGGGQVQPGGGIRSTGGSGPAGGGGGGHYTADGMPLAFTQEDFLVLWIGSSKTGVFRNSFH